MLGCVSHTGLCGGYGAIEKKRRLEQRIDLAGWIENTIRVSFAGVSFAYSRAE